MKLGIVIPWREAPSRLAPFEYTINWYKQKFPDAEIFFCDRAGKEWQAAASRNDGVRKAEAAGCDLLIIADADTIPEIDALIEAIDAAKEDVYVHNPYTWCRYLDDKSTQEILAGKKDIYLVDRTRDMWEMNWAAGGIFVCKPEAWWLLGGMDEKIVHGPEDLVFQRVHEVVHGTPFIKHVGKINCFAHVKKEKENQEDWDRENLNLYWYNKYMSVDDPNEIIRMVKATSIEV